MYYEFTYRRNFLWKTYNVIGHKFEEKQNKMCLYLKDGGIREIKKWNDCECKLGSDWFAATKKEMENRAGQSIPTKEGG
jgi:hypothetical protein